MISLTWVVVVLCIVLLGKILEVGGIDISTNNKHWAMVILQSTLGLIIVLLPFVMAGEFIYTFWIK